MSTTAAAAPRSPLATSWHIHRPVHLLRPPCHALHQRCPAAPQDPQRRRHLQCRAPRRRLWCPFAGASGDYANVISRNPDNGTSTRASRDYAIVISRNPDNGTWAGGVSRQGKATTNDGKADDARHPLVPLLLRWQWPLLSKGGLHHLIYVG